MKKKLKLFLTGIISAFMLAGCGNGISNEMIMLNGSTSMEKLSGAISEVFKGKDGNITVTAQFTGSSAGIESVINKTADIGNSSRELKSDEATRGAVGNVVAIDGIAIITDSDNIVTDLTTDEIRDIYMGKISNWSELGGNDTQIVVVGREAGSGTRGAFEGILGIEDECKYAQEIDSTGAVVGKVEITPGAIGYVSLDVLEEANVGILSVDGIEPNIDNIKTGAYSISRPFIMATNGTIEEQKESVKELFEFIKSDEGQKVIENVGLVPSN